MFTLNLVLLITWRSYPCAHSTFHTHTDQLHFHCPSGYLRSAFNSTLELESKRTPDIGSKVALGVNFSPPASIYRFYFTLLLITHIILHFTLHNNQRTCSHTAKCKVRGWRKVVLCFLSMRNYCLSRHLAACC